VNGHKIAEFYLIKAHRALYPASSCCALAHKLRPPLHMGMLPIPTHP
jgi:hypothetical protein